MFLLNKLYLCWKHFASINLYRVENILNSSTISRWFGAWSSIIMKIICHEKYTRMYRELCGLFLWCNIHTELLLKNVIFEVSIVCKNRIYFERTTNEYEIYFALNMCMYIEILIPRVIMHCWKRVECVPFFIKKGGRGSREFKYLCDYYMWMVPAYVVFYGINT